MSQEKIILTSTSTPVSLSPAAPKLAPKGTVKKEPLAILEHCHDFRLLRYLTRREKNGAGGRGLRVSIARRGRELGRRVGWDVCVQGRGRGKYHASVFTAFAIRILAGKQVGEDAKAIYLLLLFASFSGRIHGLRQHATTARVPVSQTKTKEASSEGGAGCTVVQCAHSRKLPSTLHCQAQTYITTRDSEETAV